MSSIKNSELRAVTGRGQSAHGRPETAGRLAGRGLAIRAGARFIAILVNIFDARSDLRLIAEGFEEGRVHNLRHRHVRHAIQGRRIRIIIKNPITQSAGRQTA